MRDRERPGIENGGGGAERESPRIEGEGQREGGRGIEGEGQRERKSGDRE